MYSNMTFQKKQNEIASLQRVCTKLQIKRSLSGKMAKIFSTQPDIRSDDNQEAPDFVFRCNLPIEGECICGIEHFAVEQISDTHRQIPHSQVRIMHSRTIPNILQQTQNLAPTDPVPQAALDGIADYLRRAYDNTYADLMTSFNHSLQHHIQRIAGYHNTIIKYAQDTPTTLMFLIEIGMMPNGLWLFHQDRFEKCDKNQKIIFTEMVNAIQQLTQYNVKYVLLDIHHSVDTSKHYQAIIRTNHARKDLRNNGFVICDYFGEDINTITKLNQILPAYGSSVQLQQETNGTLTLQAQLSLLRSNDETEYHRNVINAIKAIQKHSVFLTTTAVYFQILTLLLCFEPTKTNSNLWKLSNKTYNERASELANTLVKDK